MLDRYYFSVRSLLCSNGSPPVNWSEAGGRVWSSVRSPFFSNSSKFLHAACSQSSLNLNKTQINTNWDWCEWPLSNPQNFQDIFPYAILLSKKIGNKRVIKRKRQNNTHAYAMQYLKVILVACQVWSRLSFFTRFSAVILTMLDKPYMHYHKK